MSDTWKTVSRPGYFGRRRDEKIAALNAQYGEGNWKLAWITRGEVAGTPPVILDFAGACKRWYEESYFRYLQSRAEDLLFITTYIECYDNALSNVDSGLDYTRQEAFSTHIQDIAVRNVLARLGLKFTGVNGKYLQIRSADSDGFRFGPGNVPFYTPDLITQPSLVPSWANRGSVEDFWQSNKWIMRRAT